MAGQTTLAAFYQANSFPLSAVVLPGLENPAFNST